MFMGEEGRTMVGKYAQDVTDYYVMASELDNHCVRESACHSIAEMAEKVRTQRSYYKRIMSVLYLVRFVYVTAEVSFFIFCKHFW